MIWINEFIDLLQKTDVENAKKIISKKYNLERIPKNSEIAPHLPEQYRHLLFRKPSRTLSGVAPVAVMVKPEKSCKWACSYCPISEIAPKSYTGYEPTTLRARSVNFDPYKQVKARLHHYEIQNHVAQKLDVIIMGGTFLAMDRDYKEYFVKSIYDAINDTISSDIETAKKINETSYRRVVGLTIETRPDVYNIKELLYYGATKVELGVQHPNDEIYMKIKRGHTVSDVIKATRELKNAGYKILYHIMLGLPGSDPDKDINMIEELFDNEDFKPDMLKIYPTLIVKGAPLYEEYKKGLYRPYDDQTAAEVIAKSYKYIPKYVRIQRINRDIPADKIEDGVKLANIREISIELAKKMNIKPNEIRYNEAARNDTEFSFENSVYRVFKYYANGEEYFLSVESRDGFIYGFLRLRITDEWSVDEIKNTAIVRELHVFGKETLIGQKGEIQHRGIGKFLLSKAEEIAMENNLDISVISAVGVREYYRKLGYYLKGNYMVKNL